MSAIKDQILKAVSSNALRSECSTDSGEAEAYARACVTLAHSLEHLRNAGVDLSSPSVEVEFSKTAEEVAKETIQKHTQFIPVYADQKLTFGDAIVIAERCKERGSSYTMSSDDDKYCRGIQSVCTALRAASRNNKMPEINPPENKA